MSKPQNLNARGVRVIPTAASKFIELNENHAEGADIILTNITDQPIYVTTDAVDTETIEFPAADTEYLGQIIPSGVVATYRFNPSENFLYFIGESAPTGSLVVSVGEGS